MLRYEIREPKGIDSIQCVDVPEPKPGPGEVLIEMKAWSLNYRDLSMPRGGYPRNDKVLRDPPFVPLSDGAGVVVGVGAGVTRAAVGDRVLGNFLQSWIDGDIVESDYANALGGSLDGVLAERVVLPEAGIVRFSERLSFEQAATLPCAGITAWSALRLGQLRAGQNVLALGTGGVSIFALQLAKASGARVLITSSSDEKLARAQALGADVLINYSKNPEWDQAVRAATGGVGVDHVIEVGGAGTLERSMRATRVGGVVSLIGVLTGIPEQNPSPMVAMFNRLTIRGVYVGSRRELAELVRAVEVNRIEPVIDRVFAFNQVREAYRHLKSGKHFGKIVVSRAA
jgi:NADPH:quinone reductase-like Zn-dependent oxidoreductase